VREVFDLSASDSLIIPLSPILLSVVGKSDVCNKCITAEIKPSERRI
jgi:hypothetical protein